MLGAAHAKNGKPWVEYSRCSESRKEDDDEIIYNDVFVLAHSNVVNTNLLVKIIFPIRDYSVAKTICSVYVPSE